MVASGLDVGQGTHGILRNTLVVHPLDLLLPPQQVSLI